MTAYLPHTHDYAAILGLDERRRTFLADTIAFYSQAPDALRAQKSSGKCAYPPIEGKPGNCGCAIGRHLDADLQHRLKKNGNNRVGATDVFPLLPSWMRDLGEDFLSAVQRLHDSASYWGFQGLTSNGLEQVDRIKFRHKLF